MKRILSCLLSALLLFGAFGFVAETVAEAEPAKATVTAPEGNAQAAFAVDEINAALIQAKDDAGWTITLQGVDETLGEQAYQITVADKTITVIGGDDTGLMYGGLEVAEQIALGNSIAAVRDTEDAPDILKRGIRLNTNMDMRTPGYAAPGDSFQANIEDTWDIEYWHKYFDQLARFRYNAVTLFTSNSMPVMVKVPGYEDIALDDVLRTTVPFDDSYSGRGVDNFRKEHMEEGNYEIVKKMTIDEKIDFWKEVMAYAHSRGIGFYINCMNIYLFGEMAMFTDENKNWIPNQYGMTPEIDNEVTKDYLRKSIAAFVETYPDLDGIVVTTTENMPTDANANDRFIWDCYGQGVSDAMAKLPERSLAFFYKTYDLGEYWKDLAPNVVLGQRSGYTGQHMNADPNLMNAEMRGHNQQEKAEGNIGGGTDVTAVMAEDSPLWADIRNEDAYLLRLGDVEFVRALMKNFPQMKPYSMFALGFAGYSQGVEHGYVDESLNGDLYVNKHWYFYTLVGRLSYNLELPADLFKALFEERFEGIDARDADALWEALTTASGLVREVNKTHYVDSSDSAFYPELAISHKNTFGYLDIKRWAKSSRAEEGSGYMSIAEYADAYLEQDGEPTTDLITPVQTAAKMRKDAETVLAQMEALDAKRPAAQNTAAEREFWDTVDDVKAWGYWGIFFSEKFLAAIELRIYNGTEEAAHQEASIRHLEQSLEAWKQFAANYSARYKTQRLARHGLWDVNELIAQIEKDISKVQKWKKTKL